MQVDAKRLKAVLTMAKRIAIAKSPIPMLANVRIMCATDGTVTLTATDLDVWAIYSLGTAETRLQPILLHVDPRKLHKLLTACKVAKDAMMDLDAGENGELVITIGKRTFRLPTSDANDWPEQPVFAHVVDAIPVDNAGPLEYVARAMSTDETRYNMRAVYFDSECLVATNTHILHRADHPKVSDTPVLIPSEVIRALLDTKPASYTVEVHERHTVFCTPDGHRIIGRNSEGEFPDYKQVIPTNKAKATISGTNENWTETMKTVAAVVSERLAGFAFSMAPEKSLVFESRDPDGGEYSEDIKWADVTGEIERVGFNSLYVLTSLQGETATLKMTDPTDPAVLTSERDGYLAVIMPMRV